MPTQSSKKKKKDDIDHSIPYVMLDVLAKPGSKVVNISFDPVTEGLIVSVKSPPTKGKANRELLRILRDFLEQLGCQPTRCTIVRGHASRNKIVLVTNINVAELREKLKVLALS